MIAMKELTLRLFFEGKASAADLERDTSGSVERSVDGNGTQFGRHRITDMAGEFTVTTGHMLRLVDAVISGELSSDALDAVAFCLEASDRFIWDIEEDDGDRIADALSWLGTPAINYPLTPSVLEKIRHYLLTGEKTLTRADSRQRPGIREVRQEKIAERDV
jgi:hypothetical protein